ncbi:hypothetical protein, partial [Paramuribaculum intestinale]|uniref:hypothetical protein n=1 Tax=Paramuribaculum intestinale TaxID=2094151 RepID=UPI00272A5E6F
RRARGAELRHTAAFGGELGVSIGYFLADWLFYIRTNRKFALLAPSPYHRNALVWSLLALVD